MEVGVRASAGLYLGIDCNVRDSVPVATCDHVGGEQSAFSNAFNVMFAEGGADRHVKATYLGAVAVQGYVHDRSTALHGVDRRRIRHVYSRVIFRDENRCSSYYRCVYSLIRHEGRKAAAFRDSFNKNAVLGREVVLLYK